MSENSKSPTTDDADLIEWHDHIVTKQDPDIERRETAKKPRIRRKAKGVRRPSADGATVDRRSVKDHDERHIDPPALVVNETRDGLSPSPSEREGLDMGDTDTANAHLLFETVKLFRALRDRHRLSKLAKALSLDAPLHEGPKIRDVEKLVNKLSGKSFGSFEANQIAAQEIQGALSDLGFRIACPKARCRAAATLHCTPGKRMKHGMFVFVHSVSGGQAHHGGWVSLPVKMLLVPIPVRTRRNHARANQE